MRRRRFLMPGAIVATTLSKARYLGCVLVTTIVLGCGGSGDCPAAVDVEPTMQAESGDCLKVEAGLRVWEGGGMDVGLRYENTCLKTRRADVRVTTLDWGLQSRTVSPRRFRRGCWNGRLSQLVVFTDREGREAVLGCQTPPDVVVFNELNRITRTVAFRGRGHIPLGGSFGGPG